MPKRKNFDKHNPLNKRNKTGSADFQKNFDVKKRKGKIGKGKVHGANHTHTDFRAKTLAMPSQQSVLKASISEREMVTQRNLSLDELLLDSEPNRRLFDGRLS